MIVCADKENERLRRRFYKMWTIVNKADIIIRIRKNLEISLKA